MKPKASPEYRSNSAPISPEGATLASGTVANPLVTQFGLRLRQAPEVYDVQRPPFRSLSDPAVRPLVSRLWPEPAEPGRNDGRAWYCRRSRYYPQVDRPLLARTAEQFNRRKRAVTGKWHMDETYIKVRGRWMYLYRAIDSNGDTVEFWFSERRNLTAAKRFLGKALKRHGRPERIVIDGSQTNREAILSCDTTDRLRDRSRRQLKPIRIRQSVY